MVFSLLAYAALAANAQGEWHAPKEAAAANNPIATSERSVALGHAAFQKSCSACHGATGKGDGFAAAMLKPRPKNLSKVVGGQSDGELFWKIRTGRGKMPGATIPDETLWHVVNFVRTLEAKKVPAPKLAPGSAAPASAPAAEQPWDAPELARSIAVRDGKTGKAVKLEAFLDALAAVDVVFLGEVHTDETTHRVEVGVLEALVKRRPGKVVLGMEMFERDQQAALDSYLAGKTTEAEFHAAARPWSNYFTGYRALVESAKARGVPVVGTNFPKGLQRRLAMMGKDKSLDKLEGADRANAPKKLFANSPAYWRRVDNAIRGHIGMMGVDQSDTERLLSTQSLRDNSMGEACATALDNNPGSMVLHVNGGFHSAYWDGTVRQFRFRKPDAKVLTVSVVPTGNPGIASPGGKPIADYVIYADARATDINSGTHTVHVQGEVKYRIHVPKTANAQTAIPKNGAPLLMWFGDDGFTSKEGMALWRSRLGEEAVIVVVEPPYREIQSDLMEGGRWFWPDSFSSDLGTATTAANKIWAFVMRHYPVDSSKVCIAGEGTGATVVAAVSLFSSRMAAQAVAFAPRRYAKIKDLPLPLRELWGDAVPPQKSLRLFLAPQDKEWWTGEVAQHKAVGFESALAAETDDAWLRASEREAALRTALNLDALAFPTHASRRHIVAGESPRARHWARLLANKEAKKSGSLVAVLETSPEDSSKSEAIVTEVRPEQFAHQRRAPICPGPFGGTTILVLAESTPPEVVKSWMELQANDPLAKLSRFLRLRIATTGGDRDLPVVLRELAAKGRKNVLIAPAVFYADGERMRALQRSVRELEDQMTLRWRPGLGQ